MENIHLNIIKLLLNSDHACIIEKNLIIYCVLLIDYPESEITNGSLYNYRPCTMSEILNILSGNQVEPKNFVVRRDKDLWICWDDFNKIRSIINEQIK